MLYDVGIGIWSGQGLHAVESRVEELAAGSLCVVERLIAGLPIDFPMRRVWEYVEENVL